MPLPTNIDACTTDHLRTLLAEARALALDAQRTAALHALCGTPRGAVLRYEARAARWTRTVEGLVVTLALRSMVAEGTEL